MGLPQDNPEAYTDSSVLNHVEKMQGKLLLIHGLIDENVHFRHSALLINALIQAGKHFDMLIFPDGRHGLRRKQEKIYLEQRIQDFLMENLA